MQIQVQIQMEVEGSLNWGRPEKLTMRTPLQMKNKTQTVEN